MTNDQIRRRIAEACGWHASAVGPRWFHPNGKEVPKNLIPNYPESHDAMAEALGTLSADEVEEYRYGLEKVLQIPTSAPRRIRFNLYVKATPLQKAEAFLRAKGLWEDEH